MEGLEPYYRSVRAVCVERDKSLSVAPREGGQDQLLWYMIVEAHWISMKTSKTKESIADVLENNLDDLSR